MMKPEGYDEVQAFDGEFKNITPGGHVCKIMSARTELTRSGKEQLAIMFDIAEGEFKGFYAEQYARKAATNPDAKWQGVYRQLTQGSSTSYFKGLLAAIENSNPGYKANFVNGVWDENTLRGNLFGGVFGQEEYQGQDGKKKLATKCRFIRNVDQVRKGVDAPEVKRLHQTDMSSFGADVNYGNFPDEEIPF